ncbi:MAG: 2Fe-2S iron-sulfur cluster-binding protein [Anaerolineae bacterium]
MVNLIIDDRPITAEHGETILQAARENGIAIPTLCYHEAVEPYAACRLCVVELVGARGSKLVAACTQPCEEGMTVRTSSQPVQASRRITAELLMATGAHLPLVQAIAGAMGVQSVRHTLPPDDCILCGLCVRACDQLVGAHAISLIQRGLNKRYAAPFEITSAACIGCATCVLICPTGAITLADIAPAPHSAHDARTCRICGEQTLPVHFADAEALLKEEVQPL